ncbi:peptidoglycan DD-metalloendopeptidase family protein [Corynebacterium senegalense]|uniref:peptidoglycan DD-metalloendopeptidase family protein n=1 Tax=Corynebacterium senegalense TaxID=2080750 RepID=UPI000E202D2F|nr:peptidoglycan DD-metalloendopeptidase family protein [Corynebacterium senegalense]
MKRIGCGFLALIAFVIVFIAVLAGDDDDKCVPTSGAGGRGSASVDGRVPSGSFALPEPNANAHRTSPFGPRWGAMHEGIDIAQGQGTPIFAYADGVVTLSQANPGGYGWFIVIDHEADGQKFSTLYGHMFEETVKVKVGDTVYAGQQIAEEGYNGGVSPPGPGGAHLHFEVHVPGYRNPVDPASWLDKAVEPGSEKAPKSGETPTSGAPTPGAAESAPAVDPGNIKDVRAAQIIAIGKQRGEDEFTIMAALQAALVESDLHNLASHAVPESKNFPNDGVAPGDYDSVGLFQQRVSIWAGPAGGIEEVMKPEQQITWFYDQAKGQRENAATPGLLAANVERPREDLRGKYDQRADEAKEIYKRLEGVNPDSIEIGGVDNCGTETEGDRRAPGRAVDGTAVGERILAAARQQFGLPYVWGGGDKNGPTSGGFDCSGLVLWAVYQATNGAVELPHNTDAQLADPNLVTVPWEEMAPGDMIYTPGHVAIYAGEKNGQKMMYEAQTFGVPVGEYPLRGDAGTATIKRVAGQETK